MLGLAADLRTRLKHLGASLNQEDTGSQIVTASFSGVDASALAKELARRRVLVSARQGRLRVSPQLTARHRPIER